MEEYLVVEFPAEKSISVVPDCWVTRRGKEMYSYWPNCNVKRRAEKKELPDYAHWKCYKIRVMGRSSSYIKALRKANRAEMTSNIDTEQEEKEVPRKRSTWCDASSSSSDDELTDQDTAATERQSPPPRLPSPPSFTVTKLGPATKTKPSFGVGVSLGSTSNSGSGSVCSGKIEVILQKILRNQEHIISLLGKEVPSSTTEETVFPQPAKTLQQVEEVDTFLVDDNNFNNAVKELARCGGRSAKECSKRCMQHVATNFAWSSYSLAGRLGKAKFSATNVYKAIKMAVMKMCSSASQKDVDECIGAILKHAPNREGGTHWKPQIGVKESFVNDV